MASNASAARDALQSAFPDRVITPDHKDQHKTELARPWSQTCWTPAAAYVQLKTSDEVATALAIVQKAKSKFALRTTGHNPNAGFSSTGEDGVVLDLRLLQGKELTADGVAKMGAGHTWGEVYDWLEERGRSAIGGRDRQVGLAGFLLGGGMGAIPNLHGLGADGVKNFEVLLANGYLVNANANENTDLYRCLKGGGSNFGIVTRFDLETYPLLKIQYTINLYNPTDYVNIIKATIKVQEAQEQDPNVGLFTNFNNGFVAVGMLYAGHPEEAPTAFGPLLELESLMQTAAPKTNGTLLSLAQTMGHAQESKKRDVCTMTTKVSQEMYESVHTTYLEVLKTLPEGVVLHYTIQPVGTAGIKEGKKRGGSIMGLQEVPQCWWVFTCEWAEDSSSAAAHKAVEYLSQKIPLLAREQQQSLDFLCMSFATAAQKVLGSYGAENGEAMKVTAARVDPEGIFQKLQNGGFLLRDNL